MKVNFYGGRHDGEAYEVPKPLPATFRLGIGLTVIMCRIYGRQPEPSADTCYYELREVYDHNDHHHNGCFLRTTFVYVAEEMSSRFAGARDGQAMWRDEEVETRQ